MIKNWVLKLWLPLSLRKKLYGIILSIGLVMVFAIGVNTYFTYKFTSNMKMIMEDNFYSYQFKEAFGKEVESFATLVRDKSEKNVLNFELAKIETEVALQQLPSEIERIGEGRFAIRWNIFNSYGEYTKQRDTFFTMTREDENYIEMLYKTYRMQDYIQKYTNRLIEEVLSGSNIYYERNLKTIKTIPFVIAFSSLAAYLLVFIFSGILSHKMVMVISDLIEASKKFEKNEFAVPDIVWQGKDEFGLLVHAFNKMKHSTENYVNALNEKRQIEEKLHLRELEKLNLEEKVAKTQLQLIKSQLNPHFLFNTLNIIMRMTEVEDSPISSKMILSLSNLLRYSLQTKEPIISLDQELKVVKDYLYIQQMRFGSRISWGIDCRVESENIYIPVFLLQPLIENAVIHGLSPKETGGRIEIIISQKKALLYIKIKDTGIGMSIHKLEKIQNEIRNDENGIGIGLRSVFQRITYYYEDSGFKIKSIENEGCEIEIILGNLRKER